jgi:Tol biopolymer transport system component
MKYLPGRFSIVVLSAMFLVRSALAQELGDIVYVSWGKLCSISSNTAVKSICIDTQKEFGSPSWNLQTSDRLVVEAGEHDGSQALVLIDRVGRTIRTLFGSADHIRPVWSPDGQHIYAISYHLGNAIARWDSDGRNRVVIPVINQNHPDHGFQMISISPSGRLAALLTMQFRNMVIAKVTDSSLLVQKVLPKGFKYVSQSVWIDEDRLLFVGKRSSDRGELWELNVSNGMVTRRGIDRLWLRDQIAISPDRDSIVVTAVMDNSVIKWNLWKFSLRTGKTTKLTKGTEDVDPTWRR